MEKNTQNSEKYKVGLCHGVFDIIHAGHIEHLKFAKSMVDHLIVSITADEYVNKGPGRPTQTSNRRSSVLESLKFVDEVYVNTNSTSIEVIKKFCPKYYFKGKEYFNESDDITGMITLEREAIESVGGKIIFTDGFTDSSSRIISSAGITNFNKKQTEYLDIIKKEAIKFEDIETNFFNKLNKIELVVFGEPIIDIYTTCRPLNMSSKNPIVSVEEMSTQEQFGGTLAISKAASELGCDVTQLLYQTDKTYLEKIINELKKSKVKIHLCDTEQIQIPIKKRYLSDYKQIKMFEISKIDSVGCKKADLSLIDKYLHSDSVKSKLIFGMNFGHGLWDNVSINLPDINFHALNIQTNSENFGFNTAINSKTGSNILTLDEKEMRLAVSDRYSDLEDIFVKFKNMYPKFEDVVLTAGNRGSFFMHNGKLYNCPAFASEVIDPIGSGDAFYLMYSLCRALKISPILSNFMSNIYAAEHTRISGNSLVVELSVIKKSLKYLLK
ncbi:PfkB family carbohydrate kinase [Amylibacter sp.]|nr:PfkB family carbohydrate kinase [Amylibacter sp.]